MDPVIGGIAYAYVPDDTEQIALGWTHVRIYWATSETSATSLVATIALVGGQGTYSYNKTTAAASDWFEWCLYNQAQDVEGVRSERIPIGPPLTTRKAIRQAAGKRLRMCRVLTRSGASSTTSHTFTALIDPDASTYLYCNQFLRSGENVRRVRNKTNSGYTPSTGVLVTSAFPSALADGAECELWRPKGDEDSSALMDQALSIVRHRIWWEEVFYLTTSSDQTEYAMPALMQEEAVQAVEWAADTYPNRPDWEPVPFFEFSRDGGGLVLSLKSSVLGGTYAFNGGEVIRIRYARRADVLDSDTDYWQVPLEWPAMEAALAFLDLITTVSGGGEVVADAERAREALVRDIEQVRSNFMPAPRGRVRLPQ